MFACTELKYWIVDRVHIDNLKQIYIIGTTTKLLIYEGRTKNRNCQFTFRFVHAILVLWWTKKWRGFDEQFGMKKHDFYQKCDTNLQHFPRKKQKK